MEAPTEKQTEALKKFAKNKDLSNGILKGVDLDEVDKEQANELIGKCFDHVGKNKKGNSNNSEDSTDTKQVDVSGARYSQNYKNGNGSFSTATLSEEELMEVRNAHQKHCQEILEDSEDYYPDDRELQIAMFRKRADKVFSWIQKALDEKVRQQRK